MKTRHYTATMMAVSTSGKKPAVASPDLGTSTSCLPASLDVHVRCTLMKSMIDSPSGMGQLIRYFEIQSQRLDRQSLVSSQSAASSLNSAFESLIKFDGVPILAPAMTSNRREALKQHKKDAVLLEKKLKMRQRRQLKADMVQAQSKNPTQENPNRSAARQLNFDSGVSVQDSNSNPSSLRHRLGATNPLSTFATAEIDNTNDFGLHTLDSVNSDFMSLEEGTLPTVFSGHTLRSLKEQKISYNLDHLCKELNVQDLGSTSGSDLSDALASTHMLIAENNIVRGEKWPQKINTERSGDGDVQGVSFCHESQDTVVEVSPEPGSDQAYTGADNSTTSGFVEKSDSSNFEQTQTSMGSSPGCGSANTTDSQKSKVHFASFILEYNTSASQSLESTTVVKKKMSPSEVQEDEGVDEEIEEEGKSPNPRGQSFYSKSQDSKVKSSLSRKVSDEGSVGGLLNRVSLQQDSECSPTTPPFNSSPLVPFQSYGSNEACSSDKENEGSRIVRPEHGSTRHGVDQSSRHRGSASHGESPDHSHSHRSRMRKVSNQGYERSEGSMSQNDLRSVACGGIGPAVAQTSLPSSSSISVGASQVTSSSCDSVNLVSISQVSLGLHMSGVGSIKKQSLLDSQASSRSTALTGTSGSSSSTIKEDLTPKNSTNLALNIVEGGSGQVQLQDGRQSYKERDDEEDNIGKDRHNPQADKRSNIQTHSPKRLNTDKPVKKDGKTEDKTPPKQTHVRRGSYTLSHPSPALVNARGQMDVGEEKEKYEVETREKSDVNNQNVSTKENNLLKKKLDFGDLIRDLEESSNQNKDAVVSVPSDPEKEGKAEHINKYLRHVQFQNSMNLNSLDTEQSIEVGDMNHSISDDGHSPVDDDGNENSVLPDDNSIIEVIQSIADSQSIMGKLSDLEVQTLHQQQMELARQALVDEQRKDMEELFVQQRREIMKFETEIRLAQQQSLDQHKFLLQNAPENLKVKASHHENEYSPESTANFNSIGNSNSRQAQEHNALSSMNSADNMRPQSMSRVPFHDPHSPYPSLNLQPKSYPSTSHKSKSHHAAEKSRRAGNNSSFMSSKSAETTASDQEYLQRDGDGSEVFSHRPHAPHDPIEVRYGIPEFSSPSVSSPRLHRHKYGEMHSRRNIPVTIPPQAYQPEMKAKFDLVSAVAKGFLTRCLLRSDKVQELIKTIKDTNDFFVNFQTETPIRNGNINNQDKNLLDRIQAQLQGALFDIHEIFFDLSPSERMSLIEQTRVKEYTKKVKVSRDSTDVSRVSGPRMSQATVKALERKRKAREAEAIAILSTSTSSSVSRPRTASSSSNSPRCQNHTDVRALKPLQAQQTHHHHQVTASNRSTGSNSKDKKEKPQNISDKLLTRPKRITISSSKQSHSSAGVESERDSGLSKATASTTAKVIGKSKVVVPSSSISSKPTARPTKSWR